MDRNSFLSQWIMGQLEHITPDSFHGSARALSEWVLGQILGERELKEVRALLDRPAPDQPRPNTVLLPGLLGSLLSSVRGISALLWFNPTLVLEGHINLLELDDSGTADRSPEVEIVPTGIEKMFYLKLIIALAQATRLYEFPYDWRRHLEWNAQILHASIQRWSAGDADRRFTLIGHSMGGLLARTYIALYPREAEQHIERVILIGSPLWGVPLAAGALAGAAEHPQIIGRLNESNDAVALLAGFPSAYQLLPAPPEYYRSELPYPCDWDLYDAAAWELPQVRQHYLDDARRFYAMMAGADPQVELVQIAGCNQRTLTRIQHSGLHPQEPEDPHLLLAFSSSGVEGGDGTVPLYATRGDGVSTYYVEDNHDSLPLNAKVIDAVLAIANGKAPTLPTEPPPPGTASIAGRVLSLNQQVAELRRRFESGNANRDDLTRFFFNSR
ncbi:MAG: alpha/beta fold hydrolase [Chloroflexi bacterium]|nr:alpha/beta fold hydrolase [Chloroflexota bacterium]